MRFRSPETTPPIRIAFFGQTNLIAMKVHQFTLVLLLFPACSRNTGGNSMNAPGLLANITGKWTFNNVTTFFFDSSGTLRNNGKNTYASPPGSFFGFNSNNTWTEILLPDTLSINGMGGTWSVNGDSLFTLVNPAASEPEPCKMDTLTSSLFVFHHERATHYNGVTPGYIRYLFHMTRGN
jgi:hypothetical protein